VTQARCICTESRENIEILQRAKHELDIPVAAIGGITTENAATLINAGADMLAIIKGK
jgi:thiamine-phosphate pyrophosphorylase